ncbi:hypothetical protein DICVIV_14509, partial [Dictyocaulus viviparus]
MLGFSVTATLCRPQSVCTGLRLLPSLPCPLFGEDLQIDWDDPRLFTLAALRRRGIPAEAINAFVAKLGLTMTQMVIDPHVLDATVRDYLNTRAPSTMAVLQGLKVIIQNFDEMDLTPFVMVPDFPSDPMCTKNHKVAFDR